MLKAQIVISGQFFENYGAHDWDGIGECPQHWKCKADYNLQMVSNVDLIDIPSVVREIEERMDAFSWSHEGSSCYFSYSKVYPNKLSRSDFSAWDYRFFEDITSISQEEIREFQRAFAEAPEEDGDPAPLPYEEYDILP